MSYQRVNYTTLNGTQASAYWDPKTLEAWDVNTRLLVALMQDPVTNLFVEWEPKRAKSSVGNQPNQVRGTTVTQRPLVHPLMIIPTGLFGLGMIWLELTFQR